MKFKMNTAWLFVGLLVIVVLGVGGWWLWKRGRNSGFTVAPEYQLYLWTLNSSSSFTELLSIISSHKDVLKKYTLGTDGTKLFDIIVQVYNVGLPKLINRTIDDIKNNTPHMTDFLISEWTSYSKLNLWNTIVHGSLGTDVVPHSMVLKIINYLKPVNIDIMYQGFYRNTNDSYVIDHIIGMLKRKFDRNNQSGKIVISMMERVVPILRAL